MVLVLSGYIYIFLASVYVLFGGRYRQGRPWSSANSTPVQSQNCFGGTSSFTNRDSGVLSLSSRPVPFRPSFPNQPLDLRNRCRNSPKLDRILQNRLPSSPLQSLCAQLIELSGYSCSEHTIQTKDGYLPGLRCEGLMR